MDVKNTVIGVGFIALALFFLFKSSEQQKQVRDVQAQQQQVAQVATSTAPTPDALKSEASDEIAEELHTLENENIRVVFSNKGGAIKNVELLNFPATQGSDQPYRFNNTDKTLALGLAFEKDAKELPILFTKPFKVLDNKDGKIVFQYESAGDIRISRVFALDNGDDANPYLIRTYTKIENLSDKEIVADAKKPYFVSLGMAAPNAGDVWGNNLAFGLFDGNRAKFLQSNLFVDSSGFIGIGSRTARPFEFLDLEKPALWGAVKNQFFAFIYTPKTPGGYGVARPVEMNPDADQKFMRNGVAGYMSFAAKNLPAGGSAEIEGTYYAGPKMLMNLRALGGDQELVMDFGWAAFISKPLLMLLEFLNSIFERISPSWSWGWAIIALTVIVRAIMWPLTVMQIRSSQRMLKLQEPMKEINERYKNDPQKRGQEMMRLYSEYNIRPLAGCFPVFIQLPIFIGLYYMLQSSGGIRFAHFLWINDLSLPDTIRGFETLFGFPIHVLPILNALISYLNMHIMPMPNAQPGQRMMIKLMPFLMLFFFYSFPAALVLYWTVQSMIGVLQAVIVIRTKDSVVIKKRDPNKPTFMQKLNKMAEQAQQRQEAMKKGTLNESRKKNPGGRSTPTKRK